MLSQECWLEVEECFHEVSTLPPAERSSFLDRLSRVKPEIALEVRSLLVEIDGADLDDSAVVALTSDWVQEIRGGTLVGRTLDHYELVRLLGVGGMGEVYEARDTTLGRPVAIKILPPGFSAAAGVGRFVAEAQMASAIQHPNVATIYEMREAEGIPFIAMEFVEGRTLAAVIREEGAMTAGRVARLARQILQGLRAAHDKHIVHRDIKPSNLILTSAEHVKVLDFGVAQLYDEARTGEPVAGTLAYMSPEQLRGENVDVRSDLFSLGVVLHEMLAGTGPFRRDTPSETQAAILSGDATLLPSNRRIPGWLRSLIARCLANRYEDRYPSADAVLADLDRHLPAVGQPPWRWVLPAVLGLAAIAGIVAYRLASVPDISKIRSLAVLTLETPSSVPEDSYLANGFTDTLIEQLSAISSLRVTSRSSSDRFRGRKTSASETARTLGVDGLLSGSITPNGNRVSFDLKLVYGRTQRLVWSRVYDRPRADVQGLQREIAQDVAAQFRLAVNPGSSRVQVTISPEAYERYLRGRHFWSRRGPDDLRKALLEFQEVIHLAPDYPAAYAALAQTYMVFTPAGVSAPDESYRQAERAALKALELDSSNGEAHAVLGVIAHEYRWDQNAADAHFRQALRYAPNLADAFQWYAEYLIHMGRNQEGLGRIEQALRLNPVSLPANSVAGWVYMNAGRLDKAERQLSRTIELDPGFYRTYSFLGHVYMRQHRMELAIAETERALRLAPGQPRFLAILCQFHALAGNRPAALRDFAALRVVSQSRAVPAAHWVICYLALGQREMARVELKRAIGERNLWTLMLLLDPQFTSLSEEPIGRQLRLLTGIPPPPPAK